MSEPRKSQIGDFRTGPFELSCPNGRGTASYSKRFKTKGWGAFMRPLSKTPCSNLPKSCTISTPDCLVGRVQRRRSGDYRGRRQRTLNTARRRHFTCRGNAASTCRLRVDTVARRHRRTNGPHSFHAGCVRRSRQPDRERRCQPQLTEKRSPEPTPPSGFRLVLGSHGRVAHRFRRRRSVRQLAACVANASPTPSPTKGVEPNPLLENGFLRVADGPTAPKVPGRTSSV